MKLPRKDDLSESTVGSASKLLKQGKVKIKRNSKGEVDETLSTARTTTSKEEIKDSHDDIKDSGVENNSLDFKYLL